MHQLESLVKAGATKTVDDIIKNVDIQKGGNVVISLGKIN